MQWKSDRTKIRRQKVPKVIDVITFNLLIEKMHVRNRLACYLMFYCGLRVSETCSDKLKWKHVDFDRARIFIEASKYLVNRYVIMDARIIELLHDYHEDFDKPDDPVIPGINRKSVWCSVKHAAKRIGDPSIHPHTLRHSFGSRMLDLGLTIEDVRVLMGHRDVSTTQIYTHTSLRHIEEKLKYLSQQRKQEFPNNS